MGQLLGIEGFFDHEEFLQLNREVNRATRRDNKALRDAGVEGSILRGVLVGKQNTDTPELEFSNVMRQWMSKMRERFAPNVIRRTIDSLDYTGSKIFGIKPYLEHVLKVKMHNWEMGILRDFAKEIAKDNPMASPDTRKVSPVLLRMSIADGGKHLLRRYARAFLQDMAILDGQEACPFAFLIRPPHSTFTSNSATRSFIPASIQSLVIIGRSLSRWKPGRPLQKKQSSSTPWHKSLHIIFRKMASNL